MMALARVLGRLAHHAKVQVAQVARARRQQVPGAARAGGRATSAAMPQTSSLIFSPPAMDGVYSEFWGSLRVCSAQCEPNWQPLNIQGAAFNLSCMGSLVLQDL